jgi:hypothetical protein
VVESGEDQAWVEMAQGCDGQPPVAHGPTVLRAVGPATGTTKPPVARRLLEERVVVGG